MIKVGVDVDGVLRNLMSGINNVFKNYYPEYIDVDKIPHNYDYPHIKMPLKDKFDIIFNEYPEDIFLKTKPYSGIIKQFEILKDWAQKNNIKLVCATSQESHLISMTYLWLGKYNFAFDELYITKDKGAIGLNYLIDDGPPNYYNWIQNGNPEENFFLMNRSWNKDVPATNRIKKIVDAIKIIKYL
jgi:uncharacterized HAD superfamily protein